GRRDLPIIERRLSALGSGAQRFGYCSARIVDAVGRQGPAVILACHGDIDLVAAARAVLMSPHFPRPGVQRPALLVSVAVRPDLRARTLCSDKWIVVRHAAVRMQPYQLALQLVQVL